MKDKIEEKMLVVNDKFNSFDWEKLGVIFISVFVWGFMAHGYMLFNKFSWGDDVTNMFFFGTTYELGRWMLEFLRRIFIFFFGTNCSQPFVNGIGSFICIALCTYILSDLFNIKRKNSLVILSGVMVTTPTVLGMFLFMFTSFPYMIGLLLCVLGVWMACKCRRNGVVFVVSSFFICCSIGVYQAWLPMALSIFVLYILIKVFTDNITSWKEFWIVAIYYAGICIVALLLYLGINEYILYKKDIMMLNHAGVDSYGLVSISEYVNRVKSAYRYFFRPSRGFYPSFISKVYKILLLWCAVLSGYYFVQMIRNSVQKSIQIAIMLLALPLAVCFIYVLAADAYALVLYPYVLVYLYFIWLLDNKLDTMNSIFSTWQRRLGIVLVACMSMWLCRYSNVTYMKAEMVQSRAISYYTTMITRMQSIEGYSEDMPVAYINANQNFSLETVTVTEDFRELLLVPDTFLHDYSWESFIVEWCGYSPKKVDADKMSELKNSKSVKEMPSYPNDGSIAIIDNVLVIKLADE